MRPVRASSHASSQGKENDHESGDHLTLIDSKAASDGYVDSLCVRGCGKCPIELHVQVHAALSVNWGSLALG